MAKGRVPTRDEVLAFIKESSTPVGKREIARAYGIKGDRRIELKALLRDLRDTGEIAADRAETFKDPTALTDITVLEITSVDGDGHLLATPRRHDNEKDGLAPRIEIDPHGSKGEPARRRRPRAGLAEAARQEHLSSEDHPPPRHRPEEDPRPLRGAARRQRPRYRHGYRHADRPQDAHRLRRAPGRQERRACPATSSGSNQLAPNCRAAPGCWNASGRLAIRARSA